MDNERLNTEEIAANTLLELLHNRTRQYKRSMYGMAGRTVGDELIAEFLSKGKVILLYPLMEFLRAKYAMPSLDYYQCANDEKQNEALIMGIRVIGSHVSEPKFMIEVD